RPVSCLRRDEPPTARPRAPTAAEPETAASAASTTGAPARVPGPRRSARTRRRDPTAGTDDRVRAQRARSGDGQREADACPYLLQMDINVNSFVASDIASEVDGNPPVPAHDDQAQRAAGRLRSQQPQRPLFGQHRRAVDLDDAVADLDARELG